MGKPPVSDKQNVWDMAGVDTDQVSQEVQAQIESDKDRRAKARKLAALEKRPRMTYDLPKSLIDAIRDIADSENIPQSDAAALALVQFVERYRAGEVEIESLKQHAKSLKFIYRLSIEDIWTE